MAEQNASGSQYTDDDEPTRGPIMPEVIDRHVRAALAERVRSMIPARVTRYDATLGQVDCKPLVGDFHRDETGQLVVASVPIVPSVPVLFLTAGGFTFTVPIQAGDSGTLGMLLFSDRSLDRWLSGAGQEVVDPELYHRSALSDAVFVPGLLTFGAPMAAPPTDHGFAGAAGGVGIHFRTGTITIGDESGAGFIALATKVQNYLTALSTAINGWTPVPNDGGAALKTALTTAGIIGGTWGTDCAATQAKAK